jgi:hypothetical protein
LRSPPKLCLNGRVNPSDLDLLAERSGLRLPPLRPKAGASIAVPFIGGAMAVLVALGLLAILAVHIGENPGARHGTVQASAPRLCAQRWRNSHVLFIENGDFSASVACGDDGDRVVEGRIEVAYP